MAATQKAETELIRKTINGQIEKGRAHLENGRYSDAVIELQKAAEASDERYPDLNERARVLHTVGVAAVDMDRAIRLPGDSFNKYSSKLVARLTRADEDSGLALKGLEANEGFCSAEFMSRFRQMRLEIVLTLVNVTDDPFRAAQLDRARTMTAELLRDPGTDLDIRILEIQIAFGERPMLERRQQGLPQLRALLRGQNLSPITAWRAAAAYLKLDGPREAAVLLTPLIVRDPKFVRALKSMADVWALEGKFDDEATCLAMAWTASDEATLAALYGYCVLRKGEREKSADIAKAYYDQAFALANRAIMLDETYHLPYMTQGLIHIKQGRTDQGEPRIAIAYSLRPDASAAVQLTGLAWRKNDYVRVLEYIRKQPETTCADTEDAAKLAFYTARLWGKVRDRVEVPGNESAALEKELSDRCVKYLQYYMRLGGSIDDLLRRFGQTLTPFLAVPEHRRLLGLDAIAA